MPRFIGQIGSEFLVTRWTRETVTYDMDFGNGNKAQVVYIFQIEAVGGNDP
jgi:hypothetical protein